MNIRSAKIAISSWLIRRGAKMAPKDVRAYLLGGPLGGMLIHSTSEVPILPVDYAIVGPLGIPMGAVALYERTDIQKDTMRVYIYVGRDFAEAFDKEEPE